MIEYTVYSGDKFTIEWFHDEKGKSAALEYFNNLDDTQKRKLLYLVKRMGDVGKIIDTTKFNNEGDKLYAFKPQPDRFLCFFFKGRKVIITNAFEKKRQKLPKNEKERALKCMDNYTKRVKKGDYYEQE